MDKEFFTDYDGRLRLGAPARAGSICMYRTMTRTDGEEEKFINIELNKVRHDQGFTEVLIVAFPESEKQKLIDWLQNKS